MKILQPETAAALLLPKDSRAEPKIDCMLAFVLPPTIRREKAVAGYQARSTPASVRLRPSEVRTRVLNAAYNGVLQVGFRAVTIESVSAETGIAKTSIYRRWPNKASMVMDAFALRISPTIGYPHSEDPTESIPLQMLALARVFRGPAGTNDQG
jgi:AcrR family transcriptional regulator